MPLSSEAFTRMVARVVAVVRETCLGPRSINVDYAATLAAQGETVSVPIVGGLASRNIVPAVVSPGSGTPPHSFANISLQQHREVPFTFTDRELSGLDDMQSWINRSLDSAARTLANEIDASILNLYAFIPHAVGVPGTAPFSTSTVELQQAEQQLLSNLAPVGGRKLILDPFAHANALGLNLFSNQAFNGEVIQEGIIRRALGYDWGVSQNVRFHVRGAAGGTPLTNGAFAIGSTVLQTDGWPFAATVLRAGDIITLPGSTARYAVTADVVSNGSGVATVLISSGYSDRPGLQVAVADNALITVVSQNHRVNLALHPDFGAFASRQLAQVSGLPTNGYRMTWPDPVSGLVLDFKVEPQYYQTEFSVSCLWGVGIVRPEFAVRIMG
jgi:P22 coat protein - gene protein 5